MNKMDRQSNPLGCRTYRQLIFICYYKINLTTAKTSPIRRYIPGVAPFENHQEVPKAKLKQIGDQIDRKLNRNNNYGSHAAALYNPEMKEYMDRKLKEGKHYNCVLNAIKNKLIARIFADVQRQSPYVDLKKDFLKIWKSPRTTLAH
ncbi:MAG: hypothetical protein IPN13_04040 [Bacteroidetes bacterium]|nr:hypothetical protein [Bacteroidota bacterium]